ncbi:methyltransferase-like protein 27 [Lingula anatina]|uniref:Methyltransferase-like protein 27 n=1 Tax=Lingula anatina TaxID=7574 RepID=A0A1S3JZ00_LINAN|nr:methyltransferase-like protein 27 [Lingula anatina]|eukprot:XP_013415527.1 methyltransferase-like protein 27 [Lingula anatina]
MAEKVEKSHPVVDLFKKRGMARDEVGKIYTSWAEDYEKDVVGLTYYCPSNNAAELEKLLGEKKDALILDVCCGTGLVGQEASANPCPPPYYCPSNNAAELEKLLGEKKDALILDVCCGTGLVGQELSKRGFNNLHALDASKEMLEQAKQKGVYKKLIHAFIGPDRVDIADDTYDAVIMSGAIGCGHVNGGGLAEMIRLVKPGGYVAMDSILKYTHDSDYGGKSFDEIIDSHIMAGRWVTVTRRLVEQVFNALDGMQYTFKVK